jgi:hypothetical protein
MSAAAPVRSRPLLAALAFTLAFAAGLPLHAHSQPAPVDSSKASALPPLPTLAVTPLQGAIRIDGRLDDDAWASAPVVTAFTQRDPNEGQPVSERTEIRVLLGDDALYVGARLFDREAAKIKAQLARRDDDISTDEFDVYLDTYHDRLTAKRFRVNPAGAILDGAISPGGEDDSWDAVWEGAASVDSLGWSAEIRIPLTQLRFATPGDGTWGIQFTRGIFRKGETAMFAFTPKKDQGGVSRYATLTGMDRLAQSRHLELLPYASSRNERLAIPSGDPFRSHSDYFGATGADAKLGLTNSLTLDLSANPDFGQVEVDPAQVNLTAIETFYSEKRPFFVEGADLFRFGQSRAFNNFSVPTIFHSRRIGRTPQLALGGPGYDYVSEPAATTIAGAAKLTGRTAGGWAIGALDAVTTTEQADYVDDGGAHRRQDVEPLTHYFAGRVRRELRQGNTAIGGLMTVVNRDLSDPTLHSLLRSDAYVGGIDFAHAWAQRQWAIDADVTASSVQGSAAAIDRTQRLSDRYLQRPDHGDYYTYDPTRTQMQGAGADASITKTSGKHWTGSIAYVDRSPGYEANDVGYETRADYRALSYIVLYQENAPGRLFRNYTIFPYANQMWNYGNDRVFDAYAIDANGSFANFWTFDVNTTRNRSTRDDRLTRGGPQGLLPTISNWSGTLGSDSRKSWSASLTYSHSWNDRGGHGDSPGLSLSFRPSPTLRLRFNPTYNVSHSVFQYVTVSPDPAATATYGNRYVFSELDQHALEFDTRVDWTLTPRLSLQLYLQPLVATGDYQRFKELDAGRTLDYDVYGEDRGTITRDANGLYTVDPGDGVLFHFDDPNFNLRSLLGNAVLRWEYRPGSTLYLVWQQQRVDVAPIGDFDVSRDYRALVDHAPENVFAVKATWWVGL